MTDYHALAQRYLDEAKPSDFSWIRWRDPAVGRTIAPVLGAVIGDDALAESNLAAATRLLADHIEAGTITEDTVGRSGRTWIRLLAITVLDEDGELTQAWVDFVDLVHTPLEDYSILDEDDFQQREYDNFVSELGFVYGAASEAVRSALAEAGIFRLEDIDSDGIVRLLDESLQDGSELTDEEASALEWTVNQFRKRHPDETLPALDRYVKVNA
jgi:hypothetical protein